MPPEEFGDHLYVHYDREAIRHLFSVAAGVDSAVIGEAEILGQVRAAWKQAQAEGATGPVLNLLFRHAIETGNGLGPRPASRGAPRLCRMPRSRWPPIGSAPSPVAAC